MSDVVLYEGRYVPRQWFRAYVYNICHQPRLAESWKEYEELIQSGIWFSSIEKAKTASFVKKVNEESDEEPCGRKIWIAPELTPITLESLCEDFKKCDEESQMRAIAGCDGELCSPSSKDKAVDSEKDIVKKSKRQPKNKG